MKGTKYLVFITFLMFINILYVKASCSTEVLLLQKESASKIKVTYKHLGEITKEDGSKVYNEFLVTASNIEEGLYIHLSPMTNENFIENENDIQIKLTTGTWHYNIYSSKCEMVVKDIIVKLPKFNIYSLDPLCEGIDQDSFSLCAKYHEYEINRDIFEKKVKAYRLENNIEEEMIKTKEKDNKLNYILGIIEKYRYIIVGILSGLLLLLITIIINTKRKKRTILE